MSPTWNGRPEPHFRPLTARERLRAARRLGAIALIVSITAVVFLPARAVEKVASLDRRATLALAGWAFGAILRALGIRRIAEGRPKGDALVANHSSWLDIAALFAGGPLVFVSKAEVARWPVVGAMTRLCGTLFIERRREGAADHAGLVAAAIRAGHRVAFFPEGTSSDGERVLPFRSTLFAALVGQGGAGGLTVQPVGLSYAAPVGRGSRFHAWWGHMPFGPHALQVLAAPRGGTVTVRYGPPVPAGSDRKALARRLEADVRTLAGIRAPSLPEGT